MEIDAGEKIGQPDRFVDEVIRPGDEQRLRNLWLLFDRQDQDRQRRRDRFDLLEHVEAVRARHVIVEQHHLDVFLPDPFEALLDAPPMLAAPENIGRARRIEDAWGRHIHAVKGSLPESVPLDGMTIVVDCAHGAAYNVAPSAIWELGADVVAIGVEPNGININKDVGATSTGALRQAVLSSQADLGIALKGKFRGQRQRWFAQGFKTGSVQACDTFNAQSL